MSASKLNRNTTASSGWHLNRDFLNGSRRYLTPLLLFLVPAKVRFGKAAASRSLADVRKGPRSATTDFSLRKCDPILDFHPRLA